VSAAGLVPAVALAQRAGLTELARAGLTVPGGAGCEARAKVTTLAAGMVAGAESIANMDVLRHGGMSHLISRRDGQRTLRQPVRRHRSRGDHPPVLVRLPMRTM